ncbi:glycosyltransferase family 2 protein [Anabaena azotica]|uniref:Glycosyltransferase family 2 protein n=1 Tax=Anabaena azotica FACHB-119 TaxID=947527 RepID=A0ABR8CZJ8_9NOST|nr:glycosyltransferase family 2 protein [Anabaena azotica]MBD2499571.1 glycosyltransferase family 2 protein [Anabaena azotica FACHB-119]
MNKLLTIAIPTYNRAALLEQQLSWLHQAIKGFESDCEIIISDNCSTDNTPEVVEKWQPIFSNTSFRAYRNSENLGLMRNITLCIEIAKGEYIWTVGDDDPIQERTLGYVITKINENPDLSLMFLNCYGRDSITDKIVVERWFNSDNDEPITNGKAALQRHLKESFGGILFMTATVYKTKLVQRALQQWPSSHINLAAQAYWTSFCAVNGSVIVTQDTYLECTMYASSLGKDPKWSIMMRYLYIPEVYAKLLELGYSPKFCLQMISQNIIAKNDWIIFLGALKRWPMLAINLMFSYLSLMSVSMRKAFVSSLKPVKAS